MSRVAFVVLSLSLSAPTLAQTEWNIDPVAVFGPGVPGAFDAGVVWPGSVVFDGSVYHMYYIGQPTAGGPFFVGWEIGHATSSDGLAWERDPANPVIRLGEPGEWDSRSLSKPAVLFDGATFHMWYVGGGESKASAGYATSLDGSTWTKFAGNPVLEPGPPSGWEGNVLAPHTVLLEPNTQRLLMWYYAGQDLGPWQIGFAESSNGGTEWSKHADPVVSPGGPGSWDSLSPHEPKVIFDGTRYHMWYTGIRGTSTSIGYARSVDGIRWSKHVSNPVVELAGFAISPAALLEEGTFRMWFAGADGIYHATSTEDLFMSDRLFIPAAANAPGVGEAFFRTDVEISNRDEFRDTYRFQWFPRGESNGDPLRSAEFDLVAGASVRYSNVLHEVFGLEPPAFGSLGVEVSSANVLVMSRTYNVLQDDPGGTFGQAMPAVGYADMIGQGERRRLLFGTESASFRTNLGCQNAAEQAISVNIELLDQQGIILGSGTMVLLPWSNDQINRVFEDFSPVRGVIDVWSDSPGASFFCYGSVVDNLTDDPTTIPPL